MKFINHILIFCALFLSSLSYGQDKETSDKEKLKAQKVVITPEGKVYKPSTAALLSTALPGLGQVYNKKYWKVPIIYGLEGFFLYNIIENHKLYKDYRDALRFRQDDDDATVDNKYSFLSDSQVDTRKDANRRQRDLNIIYALGIYALNIVDATVDAHLKGFKIKEDLGVSFQPTLLNSRPGSLTAGLSVNLNFY